MKVLFVVREHPFTGLGGVSVYCRDLFPALTDRAVEVGVLYPERRDWRFHPYLQPSTRDGVTHFVLVNSPIDPGESLYHPRQDSSQAAVEALVRSCVQRYRPDIVHLQTLQGYPGSIVPIVRNLRIPTVAMLHDFWPLCPRVLLFRPDGTACAGPGGGHNCVQFCAVPRPWTRRFYRFGSRLPDGWCQKAFEAAKGVYQRFARRNASESMWEVVSPPLSHTDGHLLEQLAARETALIQALGNADELLAISRSVKLVFVAHGSAEERIRILPTALAFDGITWRPRRAQGTSVRFGFLGRVVPVKGAHVFAQAARGVSSERARFLLFGPATAEVRRSLQDLAGETPLVFRGTYSRTDLPAVLDQVDVVVVPPIAREPLGLTTLEAQAAGVPVIGARIGGIPEYINDGENGFLFDPGNAASLREKMQRIIDDPSLVAMLSSRTSPAASFRAHVDALIDIYSAAIEKGRANGQTLFSAWSRREVLR